MVDFGWRTRRRWRPLVSPHACAQIVRMMIFFCALSLSLSRENAHHHCRRPLSLPAVCGRFGRRLRFVLLLMLRRWLPIWPCRCARLCIFLPVCVLVPCGRVRCGCAVVGRVRLAARPCAAVCPAIAIGVSNACVRARSCATPVDAYIEFKLRIKRI